MNLLSIVVDDPTDILALPIYEGLVAEAYKSLEPGNYAGLLFTGDLDEEEGETPAILVVTADESHVVDAKEGE